MVENKGTGQGDDISGMEKGGALLLLFLLGVFVVSVVTLASVPPVSKDALVHHLALPKLFLARGEIFEIPSLIFSYYPMNLDLIYALPLALGNDIVPKYIHFSFALLTAFLIFRYLKRRSGELPALFGVSFFLSLPIVVKLSVSAYVDLGFLFFSTASLLSLLEWLEKPSAKRRLAVSGAWCGLAMGTKYNGLVLFFIITMFVPFLRERISRLREEKIPGAWACGAVFVFSALLLFSPWMIRNYLWTENPLYPLLGELFTQGGPVSTGGPDPFTIRSLLYGESWWQIAMVPLRIFIEGHDGSPRYFDGKLNLFLGILPIFAFVARGCSVGREAMEARILVLFSSLFIIFGFFLTDMRIRYVLPAIPPLVILSTLGIGNMKRLIAHRWGKRIALPVTAVLCAAPLIMNTAYLAGMFEQVKPLDYIFGRVGRDGYIEKYVPEYPALKFINAELSPNAEILCLFLGNRGYYLEREALFDNDFFLEKIMESGHSSDIAASLKTKGLTHLLFRYDLLRKWAGDNLEGEKIKTLEMFFNNHSTLLFSARGYMVMELK